MIGMEPCAEEELGDSLMIVVVVVAVPFCFSFCMFGVCFFLIRDS